MNKLLLFLLLFFAGKHSLNAQNLSFNCPKDTVLGCGINCFDLVSRFPDLRSIGNDYTIENVTASKLCYPILPPGAPGPSTNLLIDDVYSSVINLPFTFTFYGVPYTSLIASTNGYVSFDISKTGTFSHYDDYGDLPNGAYDKAIIMGPYHDLDPSIPTSPTQQIKYNVIGTAPNRKWVLSFYKVPLYDCGNLIENTHQIILYETTGIIEVTIIDKEVCKTSNGGHAMIGLQDFNQTSGIMAPNRKMTDVPWGGIGLNETWRFVPIGGPSLYKSVQLLDAAGTVIATGDTTRINATTLGCTFPNICPPTNNPTIYVVKTVFTALNDPSAEVYSLDTVRVTRNALPISALTQSTQCGQNIGQITVTASGGTAPYTYSLNAGAPQASNIFTGLGAGSYTVTVTDNLGCKNNVTAIITVVGNLPATASSVNASCPGVNNGSITVTPTSGTPPFTYAANGGPAQLSNVFSNLPPGSYTILFTDATSCNGTITRIISPGSNISGNATVTPTTCPGVNNGTITANGNGGVGPYTYSLNSGAFQPSNIFTGLSAGSYLVSVKDFRGCLYTISKTVLDGAGILTSVSVTMSTCTASQNGSITVTPLNGVAPYTYTINGAPHIGNVFNNLGEGNYTILLTDGNGCKATVQRTITSAGLSASASSVQTSCPTANDGKITVTVSNGTAPYTYTLDGGTPQVSNIFIAVGVGLHAVKITDANLCTTTIPVNVLAGPYLSSTVTINRNAVCANINDGSATIVPAGVAPYTFLLNPVGTVQASPTFTGLAPGPYTYSYTDAAGCTGTGSFTITTNPPLRSPSVKVMPLCNGNANGSITFNISGGVAPYQYALTPFTTYQTSNVFGGLIAGNYLFRIKDNVGCTKDTTIVLAQPTLLTASAANTKVATCNGNDGVITVTAGGGTNAYQYSINNGTTYQASNIFIAPDTGAYPNIKVRDAKGCTANTSTVVALNDTMRLTLGPDQTICVGSSVTLQPQTNAATNIFTWTSLNAPLTTLSSTSIKNPVATPTDTATYILNATWGICKRTDNIVVNVLHKPIVNAGLDTAICNQITQTIPAVATLRGSATNLSGSVNYTWEPASKVSSPNQAVTTAKTDSTQAFVLTVTDNYGCNFTVKDTVIVFVQPPVKAFAGRDTIAMLGRPHQLMASGGTGYLWSPATPLNNARLQNPLATLTTDTRFTLVVTDIAGCEGYDTVFIKVYEGPAYYLPNAFTPNGDGRNDIFRPVPSGIASTDWFRVWDRFGNLMFETKEWLKGWDGTYRGTKALAGSYVWAVKGKSEKGQVIEQKGTVILIR